MINYFTNKNQQNNYWDFAKIPNIEEANFNGALERFYKLGISGLVRENIQNSLDGKMDSSNESVKVTIEMGRIKTSAVPGYEEIKKRIECLKGYNRYTNETIDHMKNKLSQDETMYISFEDSNTKGLTGARNGQNGGVSDTWSIYAYKKGVHSQEVDEKVESVRGGSHGIGKIASNAASDLHMMYFANCDQFLNQHLGGTVQLVEHEYNKQNYRSSGYFTKVDRNGIYFPLENDFDPVFAKKTRGLKIIIPFLQQAYSDEKEVLKAVCDNFFVAILQNKLVVEFKSETTQKVINVTTIIELIKDEYYYIQNPEEMKNNFTPMYLDTYLKDVDRVITVPSKYNEYQFKLYFQMDEKISAGRTAIIRTIGMKIEDMKVKGKIKKPYNAVLIPLTNKEDSYLKLLENESHTEISFDHIKDEEIKKDAKRFINNLNKELAKVIEDELQKNSPTDGQLDTSDLIYTLDTKFKQELKQATQQVVVESTNGKARKLKKDTGSRKRDENGTKAAGTGKGGEENAPSKEPGKGKGNEEIASKPGLVRGVKVKDEDGDKKRYNRYAVVPNRVERVIMHDNEYVQIDLSDEPKFAKQADCDIKMTLVDGMGNELDNEFYIADQYQEITDLITNKSCEIVENTITNISILKGKVSIKTKLKENANTKLKFMYFVEV